MPAAVGMFGFTDPGGNLSRYHGVPLMRGLEVLFTLGPEWVNAEEWLYIAGAAMVLAFAAYGLFTAIKRIKANL
jgi:hypothetical protein